MPPLAHTLGQAYCALGSLVGIAAVRPSKLDIAKLFSSAPVRLIGVKAQRGELAHAHREMEAQLGIDVASDGGARAPWQLEEAASRGSRHENTRLILISTHHVSGRCDGRLGTSSRHSPTSR